MASLQDWESKFGGNDKFNKSSRVGFDYELDTAYKVSVKAAKIIKTRREEVCLQLDLAILDGEDEIGTAKEWITLPKQPTDEKMPAETVRKLTFRRRDDLQRILSVAIPDLYAIFVDRKQVDGKLQYVGPEGEVMDFAAFKAREKAVNTAVMDRSDEWHDAVGTIIEDLHNAEFYVVKAANKNKPDYPYTNIFNFKPEKIPVYGETQEASPF